MQRFAALQGQAMRAAVFKGAFIHKTDVMRNDKLLDGALRKGLRADDLNVIAEGERTDTRTMREGAVADGNDGIRQDERLREHTAAERARRDDGGIGMERKVIDKGCRGLPKEEMRVCPAGQIVRIAVFRADGEV